MNDAEPIEDRAQAAGAGVREVARERSRGAADVVALRRRLGRRRRARQGILVMVVVAAGITVGLSGLDSPSSPVIDQPSMAETPSSPPTTEGVWVWRAPYGTLAWQLGFASGRAVTGDDVIAIADDGPVADQGRHVVGLERTTGLLRWRVPVDEGSPLRILAVIPDRVVVAVPGAVVALDADDGEEVWRVDTTPARASYAVDTEGGLHVLLDHPMEGDDAAPEIVTVDPENGEVTGQITLAGPRAFDHDLQWVEPIVVNNVLLVQTTTELQAVDLQAGEVAWSVPFDDTEQEGFTELRLINHDGVVFTNDPLSNNVIAVDVKTGRLLWRQTALTDVTRLAAPLSTGLPVITADGITFLNPDTGEVRQSVALPGISTAQTVDDHLVALTNRSTLLVASDGSTLWSAPNWTGPHDGGDILALGEEVLVSAEYIVALDMRTGQTNWHLPHPASQRLQMLDDGLLLVTDTAGTTGLVDPTQQTGSIRATQQSLLDGCTRLDTTELTVTRSPVGASLGPMILAGLRPDYTADTLVTMPIVDPSLEDGWRAVAAIVRYRGFTQGTAIWLSPDAVATLNPDAGISVDAFVLQPDAYPEATYIHAFSELAEGSSIYPLNDWLASQGTDMLIKCSRLAAANP